VRLWILFAAAAATVTAAPSDARRHYHQHYSTHSGSSEYYTARSGHRVHRPMEAHSAPRGASAQCRDHTWSFSESRRGTCSWHGGVARWL
jgi:hypothetical protein